MQNEKAPRSMSERMARVGRLLRSLALLLTAAGLSVPAHPEIRVRLLAWLDEAFVNPDRTEPARPAPGEPKPAVPGPALERGLPSPEDTWAPKEPSQRDNAEPRQRRPAPSVPRVDPVRPAAPPHSRHV